MYTEFLLQALSLIGGLAFFLYGMNVMGDGLTRLSGGRLERILEKLTDNRIKAVLLGAGVTAVIQSSSATTVTVVGFVNSGIMKLNQAIGVIMGANIGTTVTSWILSLTGIEGNNLLVTLLKPTSFTPILAIVGIFLIMASKQEKRKDIGAIMIGFAILMFGMDTMSAAVKPLADVPQFTHILTMFSNPILGMLAGAILTAIIQSSSASVGILQALCLTGSVPYATAIPIIMGQNIGTCVTALLSSIGAGKNAKRAALVHLYFNVIGTTVFMILFYSLYAFIDFSFMHDAAGVAGIDEEETTSEFARLDSRFLDSPALALEQCERSANEMAYLTLENVTLALEGIHDYSEEKRNQVIEMEEKIDRYEEEIGEYLRQIANRNVIVEEYAKWNLLVYCIRDLERISDHTINIMSEAAKISKSKAVWPKKLREEMNFYAEQVHDIVSTTVSAFIKDDGTLANVIEEKETQIDDINKRIKKQNLKRVKKEKTSPEIGIYVNELAINYERMADHCENIAMSLVSEQENEAGGVLE